MTKDKFMVDKAVILAGGKGTRLYPVTKEIPKPLLPVNKKPILNYLVDLFLDHGVHDISILINKDFREDFEWWKKRHYGSAGPVGTPKITFFEEREPLGTFGGLHFLKDWAGDNHFFVSNGDELKSLNLNKMLDFHTKVKPVVTMGLVRVPNPQNYGVVLCKDDMVKNFLEKPQNPPSKYINSGFYLLSPEIFKYHPGPQFAMFEKDVFPKLAQEKKLAGFKFQGKWSDCGTWERYEKALEEWK